MPPIPALPQDADGLLKLAAQSMFDLYAQTVQGMMVVDREHRVMKALGTTDGWPLLAFLESPHPALDGQTPRVALEQGVDAKRVLGLATAEGH